MVFARYKGQDSKQFTAGRVYVAKPGMDVDETVSYGSLRLKDDTGTDVLVKTDQGTFEFLDEVYAVVVKAFSEFEVGQVVFVEDATNSSEPKLLVAGWGFWDSDHFVILDQTNVFPGVVLMDTLTGEWKTISRVDECLWVSDSVDQPFRSPEEFMFTVSQGNILSEPLVKCSVPLPSFTKDKLYRVYRKRLLDGFIELVDDVGVTQMVSSVFFDEV